MVPQYGIKPPEILKNINSINTFKRNFKKYNLTELKQVKLKLWYYYHFYYNYDFANYLFAIINY